MKTLSFSVGDVIFRQDDFSDVMYDIQSGSVGIFLDYGTETEKKLAVLGAGEILGEMGMIEACPRSATAVALSDGTVLCEIGEAEFTEFFRSHPDQLIRSLWIHMDRQILISVKIICISEQNYINAIPLCCLMKDSNRFVFAEIRAGI